jgi:hypothetical protein
LLPGPPDRLPDVVAFYDVPASDIRLDIFPVNVTTGDGRAWPGVRLVVAGSEGYLFGRTGVGIVMLGQVDGVGNVDMPNYPLTVDTAEGAMIVGRADGCGCGNPLRAASVTRLLGMVAV